MTLKDEERVFAEDWLDLGIYDFILDPFDPCEAFQSVQEALRLSQMRAMILRTEEALFVCKDGAKTTGLITVTPPFPMKSTGC